MGIETALVAMAVVSAAGQAGAQTEAAAQKNRSLDLEATQQTLQYQQKTLSNYDVLQKVIDAQDAAQTVRGTAFSSPSFNAIQRSTENIGAKNQANTDVEEDISQANIASEKQNVKTSLIGQLFGDVGSGATQGFDFMSKMPTLSKA